MQPCYMQLYGVTICNSYDDLFSTHTSLPSIPDSRIIEVSLLCWTLSGAFPESIKHAYMSELTSRECSIKTCNEKTCLVTMSHSPF